MVALAGVTMNLIIAIVFAIIAKVLYMTAGAVFLSSGVGSILWLSLIHI